MPVNTSAFDQILKDKKPATKQVDVSAFGYDWQDVSSNEQVKKFTETPRVGFLGGQTIAQAPKPKGINAFFGKIRDILPRELSEALVGTGQEYGSGKEDTGFLGFMYSGLTKSDQTKFDDRVNKLTTTLTKNGVQYPGVPKERAAEIAMKDILGEEQDLLPREQALLNSVGRWETAEKTLEAMDFVPMLGGLLRKGSTPIIRRIANSVDDVLIGREVDSLLPKLEPDLKAKLIPKLKEAKTEEQVSRTLAEITQESAKRSAEARPVLINKENGMPVTQQQARERIMPKAPEIRTVDEIPEELRPLAEEARKYKSAEEFQRIWSEDNLPKDFGGSKQRTNVGIDSVNIKDVVPDPRYIQNGKWTKEGEEFFNVRENIYEKMSVEDILKKPILLDDGFGKNIVRDGNHRLIALQNKGYDGDIKVITTDGSGLSFTEFYNQAIKQAPPSQITPPETTIEVGGRQVPINTRVPEEKLKVPEEELQQIRDIVRRDQGTIRPTSAVGKLDGRDLAKEVEANIRKYNAKLSDDEIVRIREQNLLGPESIDDIILRKRGIITDADAIERAKRIQGTLHDVINLPKGTAVTKEQRIAIEQIVADERNINKAIRSLIDNGGTSSTQAERNLIKKISGGDETAISKLSEQEILLRALEESTLNLKKAEIVLMGVTSEAGRTLQSANKVASAVDTRLRVLWNKVNKNKKLDDLEKQAMVEQIIRMDTADNKSFLKIIEDLSKSDLFDKFAEWGVAAKLWNPTTHIVNLGGNTIRTLADLGVKSATNPLAAKADMQGAIVGFKHGLKNAMRALTDDGYAANLAKYIEVGGTAPAIGGNLGKFARTPFRMLGAGDEIFKNIAYQRKLYRDASTIARKEGLKGDQFYRRMEELLNAPTLKMMEDATEEAKHMTFQDDMGVITQWINKGRDPQNFPNAGGKTFAVSVRLFLPFLKTPTNLFKQSIDMSPLGLVKNWSELKKAAKEGNQEKVGTIIGEALLGSAISAYIAMETLDGRITGGAPSDPAQKDRFYRENKLPYAIKVGDTWYQYKRIDPFASIMGLTADLINTEEKNLSALLGIVAENLKDKTYLSGVSDLMKVLTGEEWERDYALKSMVLGGTMPSFVGHITRSTDPNVRVADTLGQRLLVQVPGMSESFPSRVNVLGYDVERANKGLNYFFNPIQTESAKIDPVTKELMNIDKTIAIPGTSFKRQNKEGVSITYKLTDREYEDFARFTGIRLRFELMKLFDSPKYQNADIDEKSAMIDTLRGQIQTEWKEAYINEQGENSVSLQQQMKNVFQGKDRYAPAEPELSEQIRNYFLGT